MYNPYTRQFEADYYDRLYRQRNDGYYNNNQVNRYDSNYYDRYNRNWGNEYYRGRYDPTTNYYDRNNYYNNRNWNRNNNNYNYNRNWNNGASYFNPSTGRYEYNSRINSRWLDDQYYRNRPFAQRQNADAYGRGSVSPVHVPSLRYDDEGKWRILQDERQSNSNGDYHYAYETENGIRAAEDSRQENVGTPVETSRKAGFYEYVGDDAKTYRVDWIADENGYRASVSTLGNFVHLESRIDRISQSQNRELICQPSHNQLITFNGHRTLLLLPRNHKSHSRIPITIRVSYSKFFIPKQNRTKVTLPNCRKWTTKKFKNKMILKWNEPIELVDLLHTPTFCLLRTAPATF